MVTKSRVLLSFNQINNLFERHRWKNTEVLNGSEQQAAGTVCFVSVFSRQNDSNLGKINQMGTSFVFFLRPQYFFFKQYIGTSGNELIHNFPSADRQRQIDI